MQHGIREKEIGSSLGLVQKVRLPPNEMMDDPNDDIRMT